MTYEFGNLLLHLALRQTHNSLEMDSSFRWNDAVAGAGGAAVVWVTEKMGKLKAKVIDFILN